MHARYCVGADGSHSRVRESLGIPFEGVTNAYTYYIADAGDVTGLVDDAVNLRFTAEHFLLAFPMGERRHAAARHRARLRPRCRAGTLPEANVRALVAREFGVEYDADVVVHDLPGAPPAGAAVPGGAVLHRRRCRAHPLAGRRAGHEHGPAGGPQPRLRARRRDRRRHARSPPRPLRGRTSPGRQGPRRHDRPRVRRGHVASRDSPASCAVASLPFAGPVAVRLLPRLVVGGACSGTSRRRASTIGCRRTITPATTSWGAACRGRATTSRCCVR